MLDQQTVARLREMRLDGMAEAFLAQAQEPDVQGLSFEERFGLLVDREWSSRQDRRLARLLKAARLRLPACMEDIDYQAPRGLDRAVMRSLATGNWIRAHQGVIVADPTGVGKTFVACPLANAACRQGFSARYLPGTQAAFGTDHRAGRRFLRGHVPPSWPARFPSGTGTRRSRTPPWPTPSSTGSFTTPTRSRLGGNR